MPVLEPDNVDLPSLDVNLESVALTYGKSARLGGGVITSRGDRFTSREGRIVSYECPLPHSKALTGLSTTPVQNLPAEVAVPVYPHDLSFR